VPKRGSARAAGHDLCANEGTDVPARGPAIVGTGIAIGLPHNTYRRIVTRSSLAVKHRLMTNGVVIYSDYRGEVNVVLANLGDQPYHREKGGGIAQLIIKNIDNRELHEVTPFDDTERGEQGFGSPHTTMDQEVKGRKAKPKVEINEISARGFGKFYRRGKTTGIPRWDEVDNEIQLEAINISTELAIKKQEEQRRPGRKRYGPSRISPPAGCFRKEGEDNSTPTPTRHRSRNRPGRGKNGTHQENIRPQLRPTGGAPDIHQTEREPSRDSKGEVRKGITDDVCQEKGRQTQTMR